MTENKHMVLATSRKNKQPSANDATAAVTTLMAAGGAFGGLISTAAAIIGVGVAAVVGGVLVLAIQSNAGGNGNDAA